MAANYYKIPESLIEKLHPLSKMFFLLLIIVSTIYLDNLLHIGIIAAVVVFYIILAGLFLRLFPFILFYLFSSSILIGLLFLLSGNGIQFEIALLIFAKFFSHIFSGLVLAFTTAPRKMASTLKLLHMPQTMLFIFILALRLFPVIIKEYQYILDSLRLRNQSVLSVLLFKPQLVIFPIMVRTVKLSNELALSAETRGFSMNNIQIPVQEVKFAFRDFVFSSTTFLMIAFLTIKEFWL
ncbi:MAG: energy-coupling factor transporter transmembrane component T [Mariniphaga sp.]|jgi:energy-coupling factor transport system permease protein|nr:energy-coupling factor transporter transmembrane component T [Mariniphaga sp.]